MPQDNPIKYNPGSKITELLNKPTAEIVPGQLPPRPAALLPDPLSSNTELARIASKLFRLAPELRRSVKFINNGPTPGTNRLWADITQFTKPNPVLDDPANVIYSGILGHADTKQDLTGFGFDKSNRSSHLFVSPQTEWLSGIEGTAPTIGHELAHFAGHKHESGVPAYMEQLVLQLLNREKAAATKTKPNAPR